MGHRPSCLAACGLVTGAEYNLLEGTFVIWLLNAQHVKTVPGRKADVKDVTSWLTCCAMGQTTCPILADTGYIAGLHRLQIGKNVTRLLLVSTKQPWQAARAVSSGTFSSLRVGLLPGDDQGHVLAVRGTATAAGDRHGVGAGRRPTLRADRQDRCARSAGD